MKRIFYSILGLTLLFAPFHFAEAKSKTQVKYASKPKLSTQAKAILKGQHHPVKSAERTPAKSSKEKAPKKVSVVIPQEYKVYESAKKDSLSPKLSLAQIENHQRDLKKLEWNISNKALEKEVEDLYWHFEIARAEKLKGQAALNAWIKALNSLHQFKWIYAWTKYTSEELAEICRRPVTAKTDADKKSKKKQESVKTSTETTKEEKCAYLVKKVMDAFPKAAVETQPLKGVLPDSTLESSGDTYERLAQTYGEKTEKDEQAFTEVLDAYLHHKDHDLYKSGQTFLETYPKSMLRYRAMFLMAERRFADNDKKEAEAFYQTIINETPYGYYAIVASERLGKPLKDRLSDEPLLISSDPNGNRLNYLEKESFYRLQNLSKAKKQEIVGLELEQFSRSRAYSTSFLLFLIQQADQANQNLTGFRFATEIIQRKNESPLRTEFVKLIFPNRFEKEIADQATLSKIDPLLVTSLMKQESGFKDGILSSSGAAGLMQLMPFTAIEVQKDLELHQLRDPVKNIEIGTKYLASLLNDKFNGNVVYALAGYNAGPHRVAKWRKEALSDWGMQEFVEAIPYRETRDYVMAILRNRYWYQYRRGLPQQSVFEAWRSP